MNAATWWGAALDPGAMRRNVTDLKVQALYLRQNRGVKSTNRVNSSRRPASIEKLHTQV